MLTGLDHVVVAVPDPDGAASELEAAIGIEVAPGGRHEALGTFNRLAWLGDSYVELLGVFDVGLASRSWLGAPALSVLERGGGFLAFALATNDLDAELRRLQAQGSSLGAPAAGARTRPDGSLVRWRLALPPELSTEPPAFLIEHDPRGAEWDEATRSARAARRHPFGAPGRLERLEIAVPNPARSWPRYRRQLGLGFRPSLSGAGARDAAVGLQTLRLRRTLGDVPDVTIVVRAVSNEDPGPADAGLRVQPDPRVGASDVGPVSDLPLSGATTDLFGCRIVLERR